MPGNPQVPQGTLNRLFTTLIIPDFPQLNLTVSLLARPMIRISFGGRTSVPLETATGIVQSPEPFQMATIRAAVLKANNIGNSYERQRKRNSLIGDIVLQGDADTLDPYPIVNCSIENVPEVTFDGTDPGYLVIITGAYQINSDLYNT